MMRTNSFLLKIIFLYFFVFFPLLTFSQNITIKGKVSDKATKEPLIGCQIGLAGKAEGTITDADGRYEFSFLSTGKDSLFFSYIGYESLTFLIDESFSILNVQLEEESIIGDEVVISGSRVSEKISASISSIQKINSNQIQASASGNFYQSLGNLKEVDITTSSLGFQILNTRGFNTTAPVRIVQFIDGMDNQAPGLNFPVGNLVGASDLDLESVELINGAASALYGANAFQGVVSMTSKNPFDYKGLSIKMKGGSNALFDGSIRYANTLGKKDKFAFKITGSYFRANDWIPNDSVANRYGDISTTLDISAITRKLQYSTDSSTASDFRKLNVWLNFFPIANPGKKEVSAPGYMEEELSDGNTESLKLGASMAYKINNKWQLAYDYRFGRGTAVYQGSNRYSINNILFQQHKIELSHPNFLLKAYTTIENAGDSYDMVFAAVNLSKGGITNYAGDWIKEYFTRMKEFTNDFDADPEQWMVDSAKALANSVSEQTAWINSGTSEFDSAYSLIKEDADFKSGAKFQDKSALQHVEAQYNKEWGIFGLVAGTSFRNYSPNSFGTIFKDTLVNPSDTLSNGKPNPKGEYLNLNTWEVGGFAQGTFKLFDDHLKLVGSARIDKHKNFNLQFSPRISVLGTWRKNTFRVSAQSAFRSPTLQNQYILLDLGPLLLRGNIDGNNNLYDYQSVKDFQANYDSTFDINAGLLKQIKIDKIKPEQLKSIELGYRGVWFKDFYIDIVGYFNIYSNFIGDLRVIEPTSPAVAGEESGLDAILSKNYRLVQYAVNAKESVKSYGVSFGVNYYFWKNMVASANYTWADLSTKELTDPIVPGFNTPNHKFNIGLGAKNVWKGLGFSSNFKWVSNFVWESSFGDGPVPSFYTLDAQVNYEFPKWFTLFVGGSNITNNRHIEAYGSPLVGGMAYGGFTFRLEK